MKSRIFIGEVVHARLTPTEHNFRYPLYFYAFALDELSQLNSLSPLFGFNQAGIVSLYDSDYLDAGVPNSPVGGIRERLNRFLRSENCTEEINRVELITSARYFGYVFNPVSFYYCYGPSDTLVYNVAEVNNTFGERHLYILSKSQSDSGKFPGRYTRRKSFHVSPFYDLQGEYDFYFSSIEKDLDIRINILRQGKVDFRSRLTGHAQALTVTNLMRTLARFPISAALTTPRILWQAAKLHYSKKLPVFTKPNPSSHMTIQIAPPTLREKIGMHFIFGLLDRMRRGRLTLTLPDGSQRHFGDPSSEVRAEMHIKNYCFFWRSLWSGDVGMGECYTEDHWTTPSLTTLFNVFISNEEELYKTSNRLAFFGRVLNTLRHLLKKNTFEGSRKNIVAHYDLSNEFFQSFLDPSLTYSSAVFAHPSESLESAQYRKVHMMLDKALIRSGEQVLEIGSGWGTLAIQAAQRHNCKVTSITLSDKQLELARARVQEAGVADKVSIELCDYRKAQGKFDKIVSVEMVEAVGFEYLGTFFESCDRLLKPNGLVVLQVITMPESRYSEYKKAGDWIQKHIFPGCHVPSLQALTDAMSKHSSFIIENVENIAPHYARTLREWREGFIAKWPEIKKLGFTEDFKRTWEYYLAYCESGFETRSINVLQLVLTRPKNLNLIDRDRRLSVAPADLKVLKLHAG